MFPSAVLLLVDIRLAGLVRKYNVVCTFVVHLQRLEEMATGYRSIPGGELHIIPRYCQWWSNLYMPSDATFYQLWHLRKVRMGSGLPGLGKCFGKLLQLKAVTSSDSRRKLRMLIGFYLIGSPNWHTLPGSSVGNLGTGSWIHKRKNEHDKYVRDFQLRYQKQFKWQMY